MWIFNKKNLKDQHTLIFGDIFQTQTAKLNKDFKGHFSGQAWQRKVILRSLFLRSKTAMKRKFFWGYLLKDN